jgi:hypothetical protein
MLAKGVSFALTVNVHVHVFSKTFIDLYLRDTVIY